MFAIQRARTSIPFPAENVAYGGHLLPNWQAQLAKIALADGSSQGICVVIGDSWIANDSRITKNLRAILQASYGDAGIGFVPACNDPNLGLPTGVTRNVTGTWTNRLYTSTPAGRGADLYETNSNDVSTPGAIDWAFSCRQVYIHYLEQAGGGAFRWQVDAGGWTTVDTAGATDAARTVEITGLSDASHTVYIEVTAAGTAGVTLFGIDMQRTGNGVRLHKLGQSGAQGLHWAVMQDETLWAAQLQALAPQLAIILLGTNDDSADVAPTLYRTYIETLAARIVTAVPTCDVLLLSPSANGLTAGAYSMGQYVAQLRAAAVANSWAMFDAFTLLDDYVAANARGLYTNTSHINETGGRLISAQLIRHLLDL